MQKIVAIYLIFQAPASIRARKNVVRKNAAGGPMRQREVQIPADILIGEGSGANSELRLFISQALRKNVTESDVSYYVKAEIERTSGRKLYRYFKTAVPRTAINF